MQRPTAPPRIPASASGVSKQRSGPKRSRSPAVARKTPPPRPTSSPMTITSASRSSSTWKQSLMASRTVRSAKPRPQGAAQLGQVAFERGGRVDERVLEQERRVGGRLGLGGRDPLAHHVCRLAPDRLGHLVGENPRAPQVAL